MPASAIPAEPHPREAPMSSLRLIPLNELGLDPRLIAMADRIAESPPGLVLVTGQGGSGKLTTALALAERLARPARPVLLLHAAHTELGRFEPLPATWRRVVVAADRSPSALTADEALWREALSAGDISDDAVLVLEGLDHLNARPVLAASRGRWLVAPVDTPLLGLDVA